MRKIRLTSGKYTLVDDENYKALSKFNWYFARQRKENSGYAVRNGPRVGGKRLYMISMHREILGLKYQDKKQCDHINGNGLDNRRENLRICTAQQNSCNQKIRKNNTSGYKGVHWDRSRMLWRTTIKINRKLIFLGRFKNRIKAAKAYNKAAKQLFGNFANLNIINN